MNRSPFITRRTCMMLLLLLGSGAIVNVTVAWGSALWIDGLADFSDFKTGYSRRTGEVWRIACGDAPGCTIVLAEPWRHLPPPMPPPNATNDEMMMYVQDRARWEAGEARPLNPEVPTLAAPYWSQARTPAPVSEQRVDSNEEARG